MNKHYLFLDYDGTVVLNGNLKFETELLDNILTLCELGRYKIVISSVWRNMKPLEELKKEMSKYSTSFNYLVIDKTPLVLSDDSRYERGEEIKQWLDENNVSIDDCIIIDDNDEFLPEQQHRFVHCESHKGFDKERLNYALELI